MHLLHHSQSSSIDNKKTYFTSVLSYAREPQTKLNVYLTLKGHVNGLIYHITCLLSAVFVLTKLYMWLRRFNTATDFQHNLTETKTLRKTRAFSICQNWLAKPVKSYGEFHY